MEQTPRLDDFALFLAVADAGGLAGAAESTGVSPPTLSRRLTELEQRLGEKLFLRGKRGYALTARGRALVEEAEPLREIAHRLRDFGQRSAQTKVRITAGFWTSAFLARHIGRVWSPDAKWVPEFVSSNTFLDIARREADIGIRNTRPTQSWLAGRLTTHVQFAEYASAPDVTGYVNLPEDIATAPSNRWVTSHHAEKVVTYGSSTALLVELARAGIGRAVLPTFAGDTQPGLIRLGPVIDELQHEEWLVAHHEARHDPPVRAALDAITQLLTDKALRPVG
ncbi:MAG: LysR family transcriptional regulator [Maritimibacter sp.]